MPWLRSVLLHLAALLLLLVCVGPIALSLFASVMPDQAIFAFPPHWFGYRATLDNYALHLHRPAAGRLSHRRRQPGDDLGCGAPGARRHVEQHRRGAGRDGGQHRPRRPCRLRFRPSALSRPDRELPCDHHVTPGAGGGARRALLSDRAELWPARHQARPRPGPLDPHPAVHGADPDGVLPPHPARARGSGRARRLRPRSRHSATCSCRSRAPA